MSAPTISAPPHLLTRFAQTAPPAWPPPLCPPSHCVHPVSVPSPSSRKRGRKGGSAHPPPARAVPRPAPPHPASPSPLCACWGRRRDSAPPPSFPFTGSSPLYLGCTPPRLHVLHPLCTHAGGRVDRASPLPFRSRASASARAAPPPPAYAPPAARARPPPPFVRMRGEGQGGQCAPPPSVRPSTRASPSLPPSLQCTSPRPPASPFAHMLGRHKGRCLPPSRARAVPSTRAAPLPRAPPLPHAQPRLHALHPSCAHTGSAGGTGVRAMGGPCRGGHASGEGHTQGVHA